MNKTREQQRRLRQRAAIDRREGVSRRLYRIWLRQGYRKSPSAFFGSVGRSAPAQQ